MREKESPLNADKGKTDQILEEIRKRKSCTETVEVEEEKAELVIFILNGDHYAFYGSDIREILPYQEIAFVPGCPDSILGIINVRGDIESVVNLHKIMSLGETQVTKNSRIIIAQKEGIRSGILVDSVEDVINVPVGILKRPLSTLEKGIREVAIGGETIYGGKYVTLLDLSKIFAKISV